MLYELLGAKKTVSVIGMCKNAGKTTVLNSLIGECEEHGEALGLTSIGRDGERSDLVTNTKKPEIFVLGGAVIATAEGLLKEGDVSREILAATGIPTPMGEIIIVRARSSGFVQLGGASINSQQRAVRDMLFSFGCTRVLIDGAISRKTLGDPSLADGVILSSGASYDPDIRLTVSDTAYYARVFGLGVFDGAKPGGGRFTLVRGGESFSSDTLRELAPELKKGADALLLRGAVTDNSAKELVSYGKLLKDTLLVAEDASKLLLKQAEYERLARITRGFAVEHGTHLLAVTVNPFSAYGLHYDKKDFFDRVNDALKAAGVGCPVIDVRYAFDETA